MSRRMKQAIVAVCTLITCVARTSEASNRATVAGPSCPAGDYEVCATYSEWIACENDMWICAGIVEQVFNCGVNTEWGVNCYIDQEDPPAADYLDPAYNGTCPGSGVLIYCHGINQ